MCHRQFTTDLYSVEFKGILCLMEELTDLISRELTEDRVMTVICYLYQLLIFDEDYLLDKEYVNHINALPNQGCSVFCGILQVPLVSHRPYCDNLPGAAPGNRKIKIRGWFFPSADVLISYAFFLTAETNRKRMVMMAASCTRRHTAVAVSIPRTSAPMVNSSTSSVMTASTPPAPAQ